MKLSAGLRVIFFYFCDWCNAVIFMEDWRDFIFQEPHTVRLILAGPENSLYFHGEYFFIIQSEGFSRLSALAFIGGWRFTSLDKSSNSSLLLLQCFNGVRVILDTQKNRFNRPLFSSDRNWESTLTVSSLTIYEMAIKRMRMTIWLENNSLHEEGWAFHGWSRNNEITSLNDRAIHVFWTGWGQRWKKIVG